MRDKINLSRNQAIAIVGIIVIVLIGTFYFSKNIKQEKSYSGKIVKTDFPESFEAGQTEELKVWVSGEPEGTYLVTLTAMYTTTTHLNLSTSGKEIDGKEIIPGELDRKREVYLTPGETKSVNFTITAEENIEHTGDGCLALSLYSPKYRETILEEGVYGSPLHESDVTFYFSPKQ